MPLVLDPIQSGYNLSKINENFERIEGAWDEKLDRIVSTQRNNMEQELDMDSNRIINHPNARIDEVGGQQDLVLVEDITKLGDYSGVIPTVDSYIGNGSRTTFAFSSNVSDARAVGVYVGGLRQEPNTDFFLSGPNVVLNTAPVSGVSVDIYAYNPTILENGAPVYATPKHAGFTGDGNTVTFAIDAQGAGTLEAMCYIDGVKQNPFDDYTSNNGVTTFTEAPPVNSQIDITIWAPFSADGNNIVVTSDGSTFGRDLSERFADVINVKDYGAIGDGIADDTAAVQRAFDDSGYVLIPEGTFKITSVTTNNEDTFIFGNGTLSQLYTTPQEFFDNFVVVMVQCGPAVRSFRMEGITVEADGYGVDWEVDLGKGYPGGDYYPAPVWGLGTFDPFSAYNNVESTTLRNCTFRNLYGRGCSISGRVNITDNEFINCTGYKPVHDLGEGFDADGDGIYITNTVSTNDPRGGIVEGNYIYTNVHGRAGIVCEFDTDNITIQGNDIGFLYERGVHCESNPTGTISVLNNKIQAQNCILVADTRVIADGNYLEVLDSLFPGGKIYGNLAGALSVIGGSNDCVATHNEMQGAPSLRNAQVIYTESGTVNLQVLDNQLIQGKITFVGASSVRMYRNTLSYNGASSTRDTFYLGSGNDYIIKDNIMTNYTITAATNPARIAIEDNIFEYSAGLTEYLQPIVLDGVGTAGIFIDNNEFRTTNNTNSQIVFWNGNAGGELGSMSGNKVVDANINKTMVSVGGGIPAPFQVKETNYFIHPNTNDKHTGRFNSVDASGWRGRTEFGTAAPTSGLWEQNDIVENIGFDGGNPVRWICSAGGTPGTWVAHNI